MDLMVHMPMRLAETEANPSDEILAPKLIFLFENRFFFRELIDASYYIKISFK